MSRLTRVLIVSSLLFSTVPASAQLIPGAIDVFPGEEVEVFHAGSYVPGVVDSFMAGGWVLVKYTVDGQELKQPLVPKDPWLRKKGEGVSTNPGPGRAKNTNSSSAKPRALRPVNPQAPVKTQPTAPTRTWSDNTGKFKIEASFDGTEDGNVKLKKVDGTVIKVPHGKLSAGDQAFVRGQGAAQAAATEANPFATANVVPAEVVPPETPPTQTPARTVVSARQAQWATAQQLKLQTPTVWALAPDAAPTQIAAADAAVMLQVGRRSGFDDDAFFEAAESILSSPSSGQAIVVLVNDPPSGNRRVRLSRINMRSGKLLDEILYAHPAATPVALSPSGTLLASLIATDNPADSRAIEISRLSGGRLVGEQYWTMGTSTDFAKDFQDVYFVGEDKLLTIRRHWGGIATLWDLDKGQALWTLNFAVGGHALSAGRKQLAVPTDDGIAILDMQTGATLARLAAEPQSASGLAFSPDGTRLARVSPRHVDVWDLTTGKEAHSVWFPKQLSGYYVDFLSGPYVVIDREFLVDLEKRIVLWQYSRNFRTIDDIGAVAGGKLWAVGKGSSERLKVFSLTVPDGAAEKTAKGLTAASVLALKPGSTVSLRVNLPGVAEADVKQATKNLTNRLLANGMVIGEGGPFVLQATIEDLGSETVKYARFAFDRVGEEATVNRQISVLSLKENGQEIWAASGSFGAPSSVRQRSGQSIQDAVNEQKANPALFFLDIDLPSYLARHPKGGTYGSTVILQ